LRCPNLRPPGRPNDLGQTRRPPPRYGGNKLVNEYLLGVSAGQNADTLITIGALQSNHARQTAAAAAV
jgi:1-aminocyclopropane-1-carboxylate deaminase/D-cysteine desulfhydrase-like pyridoxal-dependent ACC family enzyme